MKYIKYPLPSTWASLCKRPTIDQSAMSDKISTILNAIKTGGDQSLLELTVQFDKVALEDLRVSESAIQAAETAVSSELKAAIQVAYQNIKRFHSAQKESIQKVETTQGVNCWRKSVGIEKVGLYIPGGSAPLFSTLLMLGVPAQIAGCKEIVICTPPRQDATISPVILYVANLLGIKNIYKVGGAQAIAAMAYGTKSIPKVDKIFGPGNQYVTAAKQAIQQEGVAIDMPAGPSEVLVLADETCEAAFVAADLLSQAEHGADSQVILVTTSEQVATAVQAALAVQLERLPRKKIAEAALNNSQIIILETTAEAMSFSNLYAPEHLIIATKNAMLLAEKVINAGSVFIGNYTCESAGDYASGTNHTLPTNRYARAYSGVSLDSFIKKITFQHISAQGIQNLGGTIEKLATAEGLEAHKNAVSIRLKALGSSKQKTENPNTSTELPIRACIQNLKAYSSARSEFKGAATTFLDANESPFDNGLNRYPDPLQAQVKAQIAAIKGINANHIFLGNGSDEALDLIFKTFCEPKRDKVLTFAPTYGMYQVIADIQEVDLISLPLNENFQINRAALDAYLNRPELKLICICSPNNPTANLINKADILYIAQNFKGIVLVDEAYIDFAPNSASCLFDLKNYPNLIILQTFSKAWGLAGIRLGMAFAQPKIIQALNKIKLPYNINNLTQQIALAKLQNHKVVKANIQAILEQRTMLQNALQKLNNVVAIYPSAANFLLVKFKNPKAIYNQLLARGIVIRDRSSLIDNCLRISIGTASENAFLLQALKEIEVPENQSFLVKL